ncbi:MAG: molybdopterin-dependent oxidoreductase, partial [Acetobacteraceae bacterium]
MASAPPALLRQNKPDGFACVSCAWAKPADPHVFEFCENGAKATTWEITSRRADDEFFAGHTLQKLETWADHDLEELGRLTRPMRWESETDRYVPVEWEEAFRTIGQELKALDPKSVVFYSSGRASLEASYMYALLARLYGTNNLPDSSNMCHESTSVALPESIGVPVGTVT